MLIKNRCSLHLILDFLDRVKGVPCFTRLDLLMTYHLLRIALGNEWKMMFKTRYDHFEYLIIPFDLTNVLISFQAYINEVLRIYLDDFYITFIHDILVYSKTLEKLVEHVRKILKKLLEHDLYVKLEKC